MTEHAGHTEHAADAGHAAPTAGGVPHDAAHCEPDHHDASAACTRAGHSEVGAAEHHDRHGGGHDHRPSAGADLRYLAIALGLFLAFMATEVVVAFASGSLALLADAGHMLSDAGALAGAIWAARLAARPARERWTFGLKRAEILSAAVNGLTLLLVAVVVGVEAVLRLVDPAPVGGGAVLAVALVGVAVNVLATWVLSRADRSSLNVRAAFAHVLTDLYAFVGTVIAGVIILTTGWTRADSVASLVVVVLMLHSAWGLVRDSGRVLLEAAPEAVDMEAIRGHMLDLPEVLAVHDLHVWTVTSSMPAVSAHVVVQDECFRNGGAPAVLDRLQHCLGGHFDVTHSTFQLEPAGHAAHEHAAHD